MEKSTLGALKQLIIKSIYKEELSAFLNDDNLMVYHSFEMEREYYVDVFGITLLNNDSMGIVIKGLKETVKAVEESDLSQILSHSLQLGKEDVLIYTDLLLTEILGIVETSKVSFAKGRDIEC